MSSSPSSRLLSPAVVVAILVAVGVPAGVVSAFHDFIAAHPVLSLIIGIVYVVGVVIAGSLFKIWKRLESQWVEQIATWINTRVQWITSHMYRRYCQYLFYQHRDFDVKGLSTQGIYTLLLDQVFVEFDIVPKPPHQTSANPIQVPQALREGSRSIWDYLASPTLANQHLVVLGAPGSGKTTLLKHITLILVSQKKLHPQAFKLPHKLPIFLYVREQSEAIRDNPEYGLEDAVQDQFKKGKFSLSEGWIAQRLAKGQCLVLLDGLDEVANAEVRQKVANWVQQQMVTYGKNRFILTSRPFGYASNPLGGVTILEVHHFTPRQVRHFIQNWYLATELMSSQRDDSGVRMRAQRGAENLLRRLYNTPALLPLGVNPLLLTMIATVHHFRSSLPGKRVELYAEICEVFLAKRQQARGVVLELTAAQQQRVLQPLAYHMIEQGIQEIPLVEVWAVIEDPLRRVNPEMTPQAFLLLVEHGSGLLLERENGIYSFAHLTFQEYLAAVHLREHNWEHILVSHVGESWWHETIRLYCAQADSTAIIAACLAGDLSTVSVLNLAIECLAEALEVHPTVRMQLDTLLTRDMESNEPERQQVIAEALLARRLQQLMHLEDETYVDTSLINCAEYQVFLDEQQARGKYYQPVHWDTLHFAAGQGQSSVLGVRKSDAAAFCCWLTERDPGVWNYRLPRIGELEGEDAERIKLTLKMDTGYWTEEANREDANRTNGKMVLPRPINNELQRWAMAFDLDNSLFDTGTHIRGLTSDFVLVSELALANELTLVLDGASGFASDLARSHDLTSTLNRASTRASDLIRDLDLDLNLARANDLIREIDRDLTEALGSARVLARTSASELERANARAVVNALARTRAITSELAQALNPHYVIDQALNRFSELALALDPDRAPTLFSKLALALDPDRAPTFFSELAIALDHFMNDFLDHSFHLTLLFSGKTSRSTQIETLCQCICLLAKALAIYQSILSEDENISQNQRDRSRIGTFLSLLRLSKKPTKAAEAGFAKYFNLYITLALLAKRIQGTFPACEGILLLKERRKEAHS
jgi:energy-coupling factor transporter ATP-binding protein EcfA2